MILVVLEQRGVERFWSRTAAATYGVRDGRQDGNAP